MKTEPGKPSSEYDNYLEFRTAIRKSVFVRYYKFAAGELARAGYFSSDASETAAIVDVLKAKYGSAESVSGQLDDPNTDLKITWIGKRTTLTLTARIRGGDIADLRIDYVSQEHRFLEDSLDGLF